MNKHFIRHKNIYLFALVLIILIGLLIGFIIPYRTHLGTELSDNPNDWGVFGTYFGAVTGLLAFVGVILTLIHSLDVSRKSMDRALTSEERESFFEMMTIWREAVKDVEVKRDKAYFTGRTALDRLSIEMKQHVVASVVYHLLDEEYRNGYLDGLDMKSKIIFQKTWNVVSGNINQALNQKTDFMRYASLAKNELKNLGNADTRDEKEYNYRVFVNEDLRQLVTLLNVTDNARPFFRITNVHLHHYALNNSAKEIYDIFHQAADSFFYSNRSVLGNLYRNVFYIFNMLEGFSLKKEEYRKIFRAQLSDTELLLLYFNSLSSYTSVKTMDYYHETDLFNNFDYEDIWLYKSVKHRAQVIDEINRLSREFLNNTNRI